jgi:hypothetical protein
MAKAPKKKATTNKDEPLKIFGSFEDVIKVSVNKKLQGKDKNGTKDQNKD